MKPSAKYFICMGSAFIAQIAFLGTAFFASFRADHFVPPSGLVFLFPFYFVAVKTVGWSHANLLEPLLAIIFLFQWLIYGWFVGLGWVRNRLSRHASVVIIIHVLAAIAGMWHYGE